MAAGDTNVGLTPACVIWASTACEISRAPNVCTNSSRPICKSRLRRCARSKVYRTICRRRLTTFVGRDDVVAEIETLIDQHRLVTLTGAGGAGKTRCATHVGAEVLDGSGDGVWLAELAPVTDPALVARAVAQAFNLKEQPNRSPVDTLLAYLKHKRLLLILDNCEHVIGEARRVAGEILRNCPGVRLLATSREPLNISGEATYRMPSLAVPAQTEVLVAEGASRFGAVQFLSIAQCLATTASRSRKRTHRTSPRFAVVSTAYRWQSNSLPRA